MIDNWLIILLVIMGVGIEIGFLFLIFPEKNRDEKTNKVD